MFSLATPFVAWEQNCQIFGLIQNGGCDGAIVPNDLECESALGGCRISRFQQSFPVDDVLELAQRASRCAAQRATGLSAVAWNPQPRLLKKSVLPRLRSEQPVRVDTARLGGTLGGVPGGVARVAKESETSSAQDTDESDISRQVIRSGSTVLIAIKAVPLTPPLMLALNIAKSSMLTIAALVSLSLLRAGLQHHSQK